MQTTVICKDFKTLRWAYEEVKLFLEKETLDKVSSLKTKIDLDLGCSGDDNWELLEKFVQNYQLNTTGFDYSKHFLSEAELFGSGPALLTLLTLPALLVAWVIKVITLGKIDFTKFEFLNPNRQTADLAFGDMLTWYLTGDYCLRTDVKFYLKKSQ